MKISDIRLKLVANSDSMLKAVASFTIDDAFVIHDVKVIEGNKGTFIAMPSKLAPNGNHRDIAHPANKETREELTSAILAAYEEAKNTATEE